METACYCLAAEHGLWTNCLNCGKILCKLEESFKKCTFCSSEVLLVSRSRGKSDNMTKQSAILLPVAYKSKISKHLKVPSSNLDGFPLLNEAALKKAEERKDKLLQYDRADTKRSKIKDLVNDFDLENLSNRWLTPAEKAEIVRKQQMKKKLAEEQKNKFDFDLKTGEVSKVVADTDLLTSAAHIVQEPSTLRNQDSYGQIPVHLNFAVEEGPVNYVSSSKSNILVQNDNALAFKRKPVVQDDHEV
jgi:hypothetical protein